MREGLKTRWIWCGAALLAAACSSGGQGPAAEAEPQPGPAAHVPLEGENYRVYYAAADGIRVMDTRTGDHDLVLRVQGSAGAESTPAPVASRFAVAYTDGDSSRVAVVDGMTGSVTQVHAGGAGGEHTLRWSADGASLGVGYQPTDGGAGAIVVMPVGGEPRNVGCSASNVFMAWRPDGNLVVADGQNVYTVSADGCATLATLPMRGKTAISYSMDGSKVAFLRNNRGGQSELWVADYNGANAVVVAPFQYQARNARWAPRAGKIAFTLQSQSYANITHVAVHDMSSGEATFDAEQTNLGMPSDDRACWAPDGARLAFDRTYQRTGAGQDYEQQQKVVSTLASGAQDVVAEELSRTPGADAALQACTWVGPIHLVLSWSQRTTIVNVELNSSYDVSVEGRVLYATAHP